MEKAPKKRIKLQRLNQKLSFRWNNFVVVVKKESVIVAKNDKFKLYLIFLFL
jgi:RNA polymerase subunit RPABC4/transcription elongation factor Spt4